MSFIRKRWSTVLLIIVGFVVATGSWIMVQKQVSNAERTTTIVVPNKDIEAYSTITSESLTTIKLPSKAVDSQMAKASADVANKVTTIPLYAKKPIDIRVLTDKNNDLGNKQVVGVCIDAARCASVQEGDLVDVYWLPGDSQQPTAAAQPSVPIARNVRVLRVSDDRGISVKSSSIVAQNIGADTALARTPKIVYLILSPQEVPYVINGSVENNKIALSKKSRENNVVGEVGINAGSSPQSEQVAR